MPTYPKLTHSIRNFILANLIIRPYYDPEFSKATFLEGAKTAVEFVSQCLSEGDLDALEDSKVLSTEALRQINLNLSTFTHNQRENLYINQKDIFYNFIYQIGVILDDNDPKQRQVEITYVAHSIPNLDEIAEHTTDLSIESLKKFGVEHETGPVILACRFIRDYSKGVKDSWTMNAINYLCIKDKANHY